MQSLTSTQQQYIIEAFPLVQRIAQQVARGNPNVSIEDMLQEGYIGLIRAARRFQPSRKILFKTYSAPRIQGAMIDALRRDSWPRGLRKVRRDIEDARMELRQEHSGEPNPNVLAGRLGMSLTQLREAQLRIARTEATVNVPKEDEGELARSSPDTPEEVFIRGVDRERLLRAVESLPHRECTILWCYYFEGLSLSQIAKRLGQKSETRVSQMHRLALDHLRCVLQG